MSTENNNRIPRLRFPGFSGEWEEKKLRDITEDIYQPQTISKEIFTNSGYPVYGANGIIGFYDKYNHDTDQILVTCRGSSCGTINYSRGKCWITGNAMVINLDKVLTQHNKQFFYYLMENCDLNSIITGTGQPQIVRSPLLNLNILIPPTLAEQKKIAKCLTGIDNLIAAQSDNVDALKEKKKGLMQQLFPQEGETTPRHRFPGFDGEWEEKKLGDVGSFIRGLSYNNSEVTQDSSSTLVIRSNNIIPDSIVDCKNGLVFVTKAPSEEQVLRKGDVVICLANGSSNLVGKSSSFNGDYSGIITVGAFCGIYRSELPICRYLIQTATYKEKINIIKQGGDGSLANLYGKDILELAFYFPSQEEQNKIVECLSALDDQIAAETEKLEALKNHKRGLMQQLFPQPDNK